jgi:prevent-host-death family protein
MNIALTDAEKRLAELVRRAQAGEEIVLTQDGKPDIKLTLAESAPQPSERSREERLAAIRTIREAARSVPDDGVSAARSQDFLYGEDGLPK